MKARSIRFSMAALVSTAATLVVGAASADSNLVDGAQDSIGGWDGTEGNRLLGNGHVVFNRASASWTPTGTKFTPNAYTITESWIYDSVFVFDHEYQIIFADAEGKGSMSGNAAPFTYEQSATSVFQVLGNQIASPTTTTCNSSGICSSLQTSISRRLFSAEYPFTVGFVPVTVYADINGSVNAGASGMGYGKAFIGRQGMFMGQTSSSLNAGAGVSATLRAEAGIPDVLGCGVTANFNLVNVSVGHRASEFLISRPDNARVEWSTGTPVSFTSMNGSADVFVDTLFGDFSTNIVSWNGFSLSDDVWANSGVAEFPQ
jgi:hypothetical protein